MKAENNKMKPLLERFSVSQDKSGQWRLAESTASEIFEFYNALKLDLPEDLDVQDPYSLYRYAAVVKVAILRWLDDKGVDVKSLPNQEYKFPLELEASNENAVALNALNFVKLAENYWEWKEKDKECPAWPFVGV